MVMVKKSIILKLILKLYGKIDTATTEPKEVE